MPVCAEGQLYLASENLYYKEVVEEIPLNLPSLLVPIEVFCVSSGPTQLQVSCVSSDPTKPPSPITSTNDSQSFSTASAGSLQCLGSLALQLLPLTVVPLGLPAKSQWLLPPSTPPWAFILVPPTLFSSLAPLTIIGALVSLAVTASGVLPSASPSSSS